jgi:hypothetical protein
LAYLGGNERRQRPACNVAHDDCGFGSPRDSRSLSVWRGSFGNQLSAACIASIDVSFEVDDGLHRADGAAKPSSGKSPHPTANQNPKPLLSSSDVTTCINRSIDQSTSGDLQSILHFAMASIRAPQAARLLRAISQSPRLTARRFESTQQSSSIIKSRAPVNEPASPELSQAAKHNQPDYAAHIDRATSCVLPAQDRSASSILA